MKEHFCPDCGAVTTPRLEEREETFTVRGEEIDVLSRVAVCDACGSDLGIEDVDNATLVAVYNVYRERHQLMTPEKMRRLRARYGLGVRPFSLLLGWGEVTLHRYESGSLQDAAHEAALRLAEDPANIRVYLTANGRKLTTRQRARLERHLQAIEAGLRAELVPVARDELVVREEQDAYSGWVPMRLSRLREMILFFAGLPDMYETKLNKLLFFADFGHFREQTVSISGSPYLAFQHGPVPRHYPWIEADLIEGGDLAIEEVFFSNGGSGTVLRAMREPDLSLFKTAEIATLTDVASRLGRRTSRELSEMSHREKAWLETPKGEMISYDLAAESGS